MNYNFSFNTKTLDFWPIYEAIKKYYPIGIQKGEEGRGIYHKYHGIELLEKIVVENIHNRENYERTWKSFEKHLGKKLNKEMEGTTMGQAPSLSSSIIMTNTTDGNCTYSKKIHFSVSLLGEFYQIYGTEETTIQKGIRRYNATNLVITSPIEEFKELFESLEAEIQNKYPTYKLVPFQISQTIINGLEVKYLHDKNCSINKALFNKYLDLFVLNGHTRGDKSYGYDVWKK